MSASSVEGRGKGGRDPCFEATAAAEYGRDKPEKRGWEKKVSTAATREAKASDSSAEDENNDLDTCLKDAFDDVERM